MGLDYRIWTTGIKKTSGLRISVIRQVLKLIIAAKESTRNRVNRSLVHAIFGNVFYLQATLKECVQKRYSRLKLEKDHHQRCSSGSRTAIMFRYSRNGGLRTVPLRIR